MNLEVRWVEDLLTLERERSISKAAEKRFISQSAFTRRIQQIEEMIGAEVIIRNNKNNIEFTDIGRILLVMSSVHDKFHRALLLSGFFFLKIASTFLNSSFFPKPIKRRIAI